MVDETTSRANFITRLNRWLGRWLKAHLPDWLYREITFQPDRFFRPSDDPRGRAAEMRFTHFLIAVSVIMLVLSIWQQG